MALVKKLEHLSMSKNSVHAPANCTYTVFEEDGEKYLQVDTYGSAGRKIKGKKSQTLQLNRQSAQALKTVIEEHF
jgi:hypothetical protein